MANDVEMIARMDERLKIVENQTAEIKDLKEAVFRLTYIVEELTKKEKERENADEKIPRENFWKTKTGALYITAIICLLIVALVGTNIIEGIQTAEQAKIELQEKTK